MATPLRIFALLLTLLLLQSGCQQPLPAGPAAVVLTDASARCQDLQAFRTFLLETGTPEVKVALQRWQPGKPLPASYRPALEEVARQYLDVCGATLVTALTQKLIAYPTTHTGDANTLGPAFADMAAFLKTWSDSAQLQFSAAGAHGDVWEITLGQGPRQVNLITHADVAAAGPDWHHDAFVGTVDGGALYGRGTSDDKGAVAATLVVLQTLAQLGWSSPGRVVAVIGTDAEGDWSGMQAYVKDTPQARYNLSIDDTFPVVTAESGVVAWHLQAPMSPVANTNATLMHIASVDAGVYDSQVPGTAELTLQPGDGQSVADTLGLVQDTINKVAEVAPAMAAAVRMRAERGANGTVHVHAEGASALFTHLESAHSALSGLSYLARLLPMQANGASGLLQVIDTYLRAGTEDDTSGEKLGLAYSDPMMGRLIVAATALHTHDGVCTLGLNMRRPRGVGQTEFKARLGRALQVMQTHIDARISDAVGQHFVEPFVSAAKQPFINKLLALYRARTGQADARAQVSRSVTYARLFPESVSFGPLLPGRSVSAHGPDEHIDVADLHLLTRLLLDATLALQP